MKRIRIVNWNEFQHYRDRNPPWIKLHNNLLDDYRFRCLQDDSKLLLIFLWLLRSRHNEDIPADPTYIKEMTSFRGDIDLQPLETAGFIGCYQDDSDTQAPCKQSAPREEERRDREETETEKRESPNRKRFVPPSPDEVSGYGKTIDYVVDGRAFCDFYASKGWKVGNTAMKDWRAAVRTWKQRDITPKTPQETGEELLARLKKEGRLL